MNAYEFDIQFPKLGNNVEQSIAAISMAGEYSGIRRVEAGPYPTARSLDLDVADLLPLVTAKSIDADPLRPTLNFSTESETDDADLITINMFDRLQERLQEPDYSPSWVVIIPPTIRTVRLPDLPADLQPDGYSTTSEIFVAIVDRSTIDGYRVARASRWNDYPEALPIGFTDRISSSLGRQSYGRDAPRGWPNATHLGDVPSQ